MSGQHTVFAWPLQVHQDVTGCPEKLTLPGEASLDPEQVSGAALAGCGHIYRLTNPDLVFLFRMTVPVRMYSVLAGIIQQASGDANQNLQ